MANSIEISKNTLLKLAVRSGSDSDRKQVTLDIGEPGFTTDTKRLFIGDGVTPGGIVSGNKYLGRVPDIASITNGVSGDLGFSTNTQSLYSSKGDTIWEQIGGIYSALDSSINVDSSNKLSVGLLSAHFSNQAVGNSLTVSSNKIALSSSIFIDEIKTTSVLTLPSQIKSRNIAYTLPGTDPTQEAILIYKPDADQLEWKEAATLYNSASARLTVNKGLTATVNGTPQTTFSLLTATNVSLGGIFLPTAHVTFTQTVSSVRSANVQSVSSVSHSDASALIGQINGGNLQNSDSPYDAKTVTGAFRIKTVENFDPATTVVDVKISNFNYVQTAKNGLLINSSPQFHYKIENNNTILLVVYVSSSYINHINSHLSIYTGPAFLTPGSTNLNTRYSVTIYG